MGFISGVDFVMVPVNDFEAAKQFYGEVLGVNQSASAMARILGPVLGLTLYKATETHLLPYVFGAAILLLMLPLMPRIRRGG